MKHSPLSMAAVFAACLLSAHPAAAAMMAGGQAANAARQTPQPPPAASQATMDLVGGILSSVDAANKTMTVSGNALFWHPTQLRIFAPNGARVAERELQPGARVRFALEPGAGSARRVVLIYLDERQ